MHVGCVSGVLYVGFFCLELSYFIEVWRYVVGICVLVSVAVLAYMARSESVAMYGALWL